MATPNSAHRDQPTNYDFPAADAWVPTPSDTVDEDSVARAMYVGTSGNMTVKMKSGEVVTFSNVPVGIFPVSVSRINLTGLTAANIVLIR